MGKIKVIKKERKELIMMIIIKFGEKGIRYNRRYILIELVN